MMPASSLRKAVQLVLALHNNSIHPREPVVYLDPKAEQQLRAALEEPDPTPIEALRALQHAANGLNYNQFLDAMGWDRNEYTRHKWQEFQALGRLGVFDDSTLLKPIGYYRLMQDVGMTKKEEPQ